jgi:hypothetical protein
MSTARFCDECENLLSDLNLSNGKFYCSGCNKESSLPDNDKTFIKYFAGKNIKNLTIDDCIRLSKMQTTNRIAKKCNKCGFEIMACINDTMYKFYFVCLKCNAVSKAGAR